MRPLRLEIEGFASFRERAVIDFEDTNLFVFTGATGSGKSSVIDALGFALYGCVSRYDHASLVAPAITQGANQMRVRLDFTVGGREYTAVRVVRRTRTGATTAEARLECGSDTIAANADELTAEVEKLVGLNFEQFTKCVVLPQETSPNCSTPTRRSARTCSCGSSILSSTAASANRPPAARPYSSRKAMATRYASATSPTPPPKPSPPLRNSSPPSQR